MFCPNCGMSNDGTAAFCARCGHDLHGGMTVVQARPQVQGAPGDFGQTRTPQRMDGGSHGAAPSATSLVLTVMEGRDKLIERDVLGFGKQVVTLGSQAGNDIVVSAKNGIVSRRHCELRLQGGRCELVDTGSTNGLYVNGVRRESVLVGPGDVVTIGGPSERTDAVVLLFGTEAMRWLTFDMQGKSRVMVGRTPDNDLELVLSTISTRHAVLERTSGGSWTVEDCGSLNGTFVDGARVTGRVPLNTGCSVLFANVPVVLAGDCLMYPNARFGVNVEAFELVKKRKARGGMRITSDHISLRCSRGDFVAIVGGSGSGKSTLLNMLNGTDPANEGAVLIDGVDLYANYEQLKNTIGYVPQKDIVHDDLTLVQMLHFAADLRMPPDTSREERDARIEEVIAMLELQGERDNQIGRMSGGQKKRASIAVELLADPRLLFLDEPTSGLDPGIEKNLMSKLADMAHEGRTIILVTHTTLNLHLCDQVVFLGRGGKLCYAGDPNGALTFFGVDDFVDVYAKINDEPEMWAERFERRRSNRPIGVVSSEGARSRENAPFLSQLGTLSARYARLLVNDRARLVLLLGQAPLLSLLICLVAGDGCFVEHEGTKSFLFALSCAAFWVGILDSIQEICKERDILTREYAGGMSLPAYVLSKVVVLGLLCVVQAFLLTGVFVLIEGAPATSLLFAPLELYVTILLITLSAMSLGLLVSALFKNPDRAIAMAPLLIMPQILFSGLVFKLEGIAENVSAFVHCRWGMEAFGTTANLNALDLEIYGEEVHIPEMEKKIDEVTTTVPEFDTEIDGMSVTVPEQEDMTIENVQVTVPEDDMKIDADMFPHDYEAMFEYSLPHLLTSWGILAVFCVVCIVGCGVILGVKMRNRAVV